MQIKNMPDIIAKHKKLTAFTLGIISTYALPPYFVFPVLLVCLSLLVYLEFNSKSYKQSFLLGYFFGIGFYGSSFSWIGNALLVEKETFGLLYPLVPIVSGLFFGLFTAFPTLLIRTNKDITSKVFCFASWFVIFEWIRSFLFTGFPWNLIGTSLSFSPFLSQGASILGTYGLSFILVLFSCCPAILLANANKKYKKLALITMSAITLFVITTGLICFKNYKKMPFSDTTIRMVQPSIPQTTKWNKESLEKHFDTYLNMSQTNPNQKADVIIWGETASPFPLDLDKIHLQKIQNILTPNSVLVTGSIRYEINADYTYNPANSIIVVGKDGVKDWYNKSHLVPFGEYIPFRKHLPSWIRTITQPIGNFQAGEGPKTMQINNIPPFGGLVCYEIIFPHKIINKANKPEWIINVSNDGWYGNSAGPYQHLAAAKMRAIEEGVTIARVANNGISALIAPSGQILGKIEYNKIGSLDLSLPVKTSFYTPYSQYGNFPILILCIITIVFFSLRKKLTFNH